MRNGDFNTWNIICKECLIGILLIFQVDVVHVALPVSVIPYSVKMYTQVTIGDTWSDVQKKFPSIPTDAYGDKFYPVDSSVQLPLIENYQEFPPL